MPPRSAIAGLLADTAPPVKVATTTVLAFVGAIVGGLETLLMVAGTIVVAGATDDAQVVGLVAAGAEEAGGLLEDDDAGGAQVAHVVGVDAAGAADVQPPHVAGDEAADEDTGAAGDDDQGPHVADDVFAVETGTAVVWTLVVVLTTVVVCVVADEDDHTPHVYVLEVGDAETGLELLFEALDDDDHTAHDSYADEELLVVAEGFTGVELDLEATEDDDHTPHVSEVEVLVVAEGFTGVGLDLEATEDDDHTPHVADGEVLLLDETGDFGVEELLAVVPQTPHEEAIGVVLLIAAGEEGVEDALLLATGEDGVDVAPQLPHEADDGEIFATPAVVDGGALDFPSQLPQDAEGVDGDAPFPLPQDEEASAATGAVCQSPQLPGPPCLSRFSATPAKTEVAKASKTNELFTMVARG